METIIVATDGSDVANEAAARGLALLRSVDRVIVVTVIDLVDPDLALDATGHAASTMTPDEVEAQHSAAKDRGRDAVDATVDFLRANGALTSDPERMVLGGQAGPELRDLAERSEAAAIVIGSSGRGGIKRALLGSVSDFVVRHSPCPVVVTRPRSS